MPPSATSSALNCGGNLTRVDHRGDQQHDDGGDRRDRESRIYRRDERKRGHGDGEDSKKGDLVRMRNKETDGTAVDRAAESSDEIIERCLERSSDAHLRHD
jgi:hypothetical protein